MVLLYQMFVMGEEITPEKIKKTGMSGKRWERVVKYILLTTEVFLVSVFHNYEVHRIVYLLPAPLLKSHYLFFPIKWYYLYIPSISACFVTPSEMFV
ncbi:hypothetical protein BJP34_25970 [Moorena producens PAL-8-15-08-1]|uniref:Uncharacterized protein n=1 Tax=Moorena producens PAL-8-15-08-1 TaxID=1458985 RepID=A0A1D8TXR1_9CYAN|nr:hypothetical protein BJP34_25970 [Moorena producens PAL-8-15-08-1]